MTYRSTAREWRTVLLRLELGNRRYAAGSDPSPADGGEQPVAAVVCPARFPVRPERLFDVDAGDLRVYQGDVKRTSLELLAACEWAAVDGARLAVVFGGAALCDELEILLAPFEVTVVEATLGPNGRVRFDPRSIEALPQILRSK